MAASDDVKLVADEAGGVKTTGAGLDGPLFDGNFSPTLSLEIVDPNVVEICDSFAAIDDEIGV